MRFLSLLLVSLLCACSVTSAKPGQRPPASDPTEPSISNDPQKAKQVSLDLIRGMIEKKQYYAASAYIEEQRQHGDSGNELTLLEADVRRHLAQTTQAEQLYRKLIGTPLEGQAYHGLGLLYVETDLNAAVTDLQKAAQRLPTNVEIRGDLGYALMEAGRYTDAMPELSTAAELAPGEMKSRNNLIILMILTGNDSAASRLAMQSGATGETMARLREEAQQIRDRQRIRAGRASN
jgi:Flp pilus assembly protein TadD